MTGKRRIVLVGCLIVCYSILVLPQDVNGQSQKIRAEQLAKNWFDARSQDLKSTEQPVNLDIQTIENQFGEIFLANFSPKGFLIFFVTDGTPDILAYSDNANLPDHPDHPLYQEWLPLAQPSPKNGLSDASLPNGISNLAPSKTSYKSSSGFKSMQDQFVEPLVDSKWGQGPPWNQFCPADSEGVRAPVGCVAVAMGQIMKRWQWPDRGIGSNAYTPSNYPPYGEQSANFDTLYQWPQMHTTQPTEASAFLLYHAGVATNMNYGPNESGANTSVYAPQALKDNFKYHKGMQVREKERYSERDWFKMLRQELINGRPLIYFGSNPNGGTGHAFNIDGFHSEDYFHFNWGWNGAGNGYYRLENMSAGGGNFVKGQAAIFWIQPEDLPMHDRPGSVQTLPGDRYIQLIWDDLTINDFSHYNVYRNGLLVGTSIKNTFRDEGLNNGQTYTYQISASYIGNNEGESVPTEEIRATPVDNLVLDYVNGFEVNPDAWEFKNNSSGFRWGSAEELGIPGNPGHLMAIRSDQSEPGQQVIDHLTAPGLDIRGINHVAISFDYTFQQKPGVDYLFLMYRRYDNGLWYPIAKLDPTGELGDWKTAYYYFPEEAKYLPIQLGFYYNDFRGQGYGAALDNIRIWTIDAPPEPEFSISSDTVCQNEILVYTNESSGDIYSWFWDFGEGASPRFADSEGPHKVFYSTPGSKSASLLLNHLDPRNKSNLLTVIPQPIAGFEVETSGLLATFTDTSRHADYYWWDFGDGNTSTERNPENKYHQHELFEIVQVVSNDHCQPDTMRIKVDFRINSGIEDISADTDLILYPNPASGIINIDILNYQPVEQTMQVYNISGKKVMDMNLEMKQKHNVDVRSLKPGIYFVFLISGAKTYREKLIIQ